MSKCIICQKETTKPICDDDYAEGYRTGDEMIETLRHDPNFTIDDDGNIGIIPDYTEKFGLQDNQPKEGV